MGGVAPPEILRRNRQPGIPRRLTDPECRAAPIRDPGENRYYGVDIAMEISPRAGSTSRINVTRNRHLLRRPTNC
jgi:hypothetical protein